MIGFGVESTFVRRSACLAIALLLPALGACGSEGGSQTGANAVVTPDSQVVDSADCLPVDVGALRMAGAGDYEPTAPEALAKGVDEVVAATLNEILPGYSGWEDGDEIPYLIARFTVTDHYGGAEGELLHNDSVYVRLDQGPISVETGNPSFGLEDFRSALPRGMDVVLFLNDLTEELDRPVESLPAEARLAGVPLEGFLIDNCGKLDGGKADLQGPWRKYESLADLKAVLDR